MRWKTCYPPPTRDTRTALQQSAQANAKSDDIENRLRRNNVRIHQRVEGRDPTTFTETWLQEMFGKEAFTTLFAVKGCTTHRLDPFPLATRQGPCLPDS